MEKNKKRSQISRTGKNFWIDSLAFLIFLICAISGYAIMDSNHEENGVYPGENRSDTGLMNADLFWGIARFEWAHIHNITGWIVVALVIVHLIYHRTWISRVISRSIRPGHEHETRK